jgi:hypothetical protein
VREGRMSWAEAQGRPPARSETLRRAAVAR